MTLFPAIAAPEISSSVMTTSSKRSVPEMGLICRMEKSIQSRCSRFTANSISTGSLMVREPSLRTSSTILASGIMSYLTMPLKVRLLKPWSLAFSERNPDGVMTETMPLTAFGQL